MKLKDILSSYKAAKKSGIQNVGAYLMELIENKYTRSVKAMINDPTNHFGHAYYSALEYAITRGNEDIALILLDDIRFVNYASLYISTVNAIHKNYYKFFKKAIYNESFNVSYRNFDIIQVASFSYRKRMVKLLLKHRHMDYDEMINVVSKYDHVTIGGITDFIKSCNAEIIQKERDRKIKAILK